MEKKAEKVKEHKTEVTQDGAAMMQVRHAEDRDIPEILRLLVEVNMVHHVIRPDLFKGPATKYTEDELKVMIRKTEDPIFVLPRSDGRIAGYIFCQTMEVGESKLRTHVKTLYIDDLCVDEVCRHMRVGEQLYQHTIRYAKENGFYNVTLHVWGGNEGAGKFYEKMGLKPQYTCLEAIL